MEQRGGEDVSLHDLMSEAMVECNASNNKHCLADEPAKVSDHPLSCVTRETLRAL